MSTRALDRNFVLQKQLERSCKRMHREYKTCQRKTQTIAEACVSFTYQLLHEATVKEKENLRKDRKFSKPDHSKIKYTEDNVAEATPNNTRVRPQTANAQKGRTSHQKRPSSAHPLLSSDITEEKKQPSDKNKDSGTKVKSSTAWSKVRKIVKEKELQTQPRDNNILNETHAAATENFNIYQESASTKLRPKTADFYRKKQPESELAIYWSRKIRSVIAKWDKEDKEENYIQNDMETRVSGERRTLTPQLQKAELTESEKRLMAFVRRFGSKYRTQMRPFNTSSNQGRKNYVISKQELASIHADTSRRLKNTKMIVRKSGRIQASIEKFVEYADELTSEQACRSY